MSTGWGSPVAGLSRQTSTLIRFFWNLLADKISSSKLWLLLLKLASLLRWLFTHWILPRFEQIYLRYAVIKPKTVVKADMQNRILQTELATSNQGECCEMEISYTDHQLDVCDSEFEHWRFKSCTKHSEEEHATFFVPIKEFSLHHLPESVRSPLVLNFIKYRALETVKIKVFYTSKDRPKKFHCGGASGFSHLRMGTGHVESVSGDKYVYLNIPEFIQGKYFIIKTAAHVVYNDREAQNTVVEFFFDDDSDRSSVICAKGVKVLVPGREYDICTFLCAIEDEFAASQVNEVIKSIPRKYKLPPNFNLAFCVSHPHGVAQRVSIGTISQPEKKPLNEIDGQLRIIVKICCESLEINEKKGFYLYLQNQIIDIALSFMSEKSRSDLKEVILSELIKKQLVEKPTPTEETLFVGIFNVLLSFVLSETEKQFTKKHGASATSLSSGDQDEMRRVIIREILQDIASQDDVSDVFEERWLAVLRQLQSTLFMMNTRNANILPSAQVSFHGTFQYSVPTCPGSSGARINALSWLNQKYTYFEGTHSKGQEKMLGVTGHVGTISVVLD